MIKLIIAGVALLALVTGGVLVKRQEAGEKFAEAQDKGSLKWYARKAKHAGKKAVSVPAPEVEYLGEGDSPDSVLADFSLVVAEAVESKVNSPYPDSIVTWYKFRTVETIAERPPLSGIPRAVGPPPGLFTLGEGEFLLVRDGGSVVVDGVTLYMKNPRLPPFARGKKYLLLISRDPSGVAALWGGPSGVFTLTDDDQIKPVSEEPHPVKDVLRERFHNSVGRLKEKLGKHEAGGEGAAHPPLGGKERE